MTEHFRTITYRIYTKPAKYRALEKHGHACRFVWNHFVAKTRADYDKWKASGDDALKPSVSSFTLGTQFTKLRKSEPWLHELSANNVKGVLKDLREAYQRFFKNPGPDGPPRFKSVHRHHSC